MLVPSFLRRATRVLSVLGIAGLILQLACGGSHSNPPVPAPVATSLVAVTNPVPFGGTTTITPTFSNGSGTVDNGIGKVTSGTAFTSAAISAPKTYTLSVDNGAGSTATLPLTLMPQTVSIGLISPAASSTTVTTSNTLIANTTTFHASVTGSASGNVTWTASAGSIIAATGVWTPPTTPGTVTITATSVDDPTKSVNTTVIVIAAPVTPVVTAPASVTAGQGGYVASAPAQTGMTLAWSITNGTITAGAGTTSITFTPGATGTVGLSCVASHSLGSPSAAGTASPAIVAAPVASSLTAATNPVSYGGSTPITPTFTNGTGSVNNGIGAVTSGTAFSSGTLTAAKTYTLTVTNSLGSTATTTLTVTPKVVSVGALSPANATKTVATTTTFSATATGGTTNALTWTATAGTIDPATGA